MRYGKKRLPEKNAEADMALTLITLKLKEAGKKAAQAWEEWLEAARMYGDSSAQARNAMGEYFRQVGMASAYKECYGVTFAALCAALKKNTP